jgi:hypothetical protein
MRTEKTIIADTAKIEPSADEFVLGSGVTEPNDSHEKAESRPLFPYILLALGMLLLGAGFWLSASVAFVFYVILNSTNFDKTWQENSLLPQELFSIGLDKNR